MFPFGRRNFDGQQQWQGYRSTVSVAFQNRHGLCKSSDITIRYVKNFAFLLFGCISIVSLRMFGMVIVHEDRRELCVLHPKHMFIPEFLIRFCSSLHRGS